MRFRKLRIAFSATCLIACVLLIVLWVRSYRINDIYTLALTSSTNLRFIAFMGTVNVQWQSSKFPWRMGVYSVPWNGRVKPQIPIRQMLFQLRWNSEAIVFSFFYPLVLSGILATLPWFRSLRWPKRFTTRTMLIATTLVAVVLGLIVWAMR
jgi:hypothetical protein